MAVEGSDHNTEATLKFVRKKNKELSEDLSLLLYTNNFYYNTNRSF